MTDTKSTLPDAFDPMLSQLDGLPDVVKTRPTVIRTMPVLGVGGSTLYTIQTVRQSSEDGASRDTIFLEQVDASGVVRLALPSKVADAIARQRDALGGKTRSRAARKVAEDRRARGEQPAFMRAAKNGA